MLASACLRKYGTITDPEIAAATRALTPDVLRTVSELNQLLGDPTPGDPNQRQPGSDGK